MNAFLSNQNYPEIQGHRGGKGDGRPLPECDGMAPFTF